MIKNRFSILFTIALCISVIGCNHDFPIEESLDKVQPTINSVSPSGDDVPINTTISVTFSEPIDKGSVSSDNFSLTNSEGTAVFGRYSTADSTVIMIPESYLSTEHTYTASISSVKDTAGNGLYGSQTWSFTTGTQTDYTGPTVSSVYPTSGAINVSADILVQVKFDESVLSSTVNTTTFTLTGPSGSVSGTIEMIDSLTYQFRPSSALSNSSIYTATVTSGVQDLSGNEMTSNYSWSFVTASGSSTPPPSSSTVVSISAGLYTSLAVKSDGTVWGWGSNTDYHLTEGNSLGWIETPVQLNGLSSISKIASGPIAITSTGDLWIWGGTLAKVPYQVTTVTTVSDISDVNAVVYSDGRAGLGDGSITWDPVNGPNVGKVIKMSSNSSGIYVYLHDSGTVIHDSNAEMSNATNMIDVAAGDNHYLALKNNGTVWAWGKNTKGQLGDGTTNDNEDIVSPHLVVPVQVSGLTNVIAIAAGKDFSLALKSDGTVWAWGSNEYGKLGIMSTNTGPQLVPVQVQQGPSISSGSVLVGNITDVKEISAGMDHALALKNDGTVWSWGHNVDGRLGTGDYTSYTYAVPVSTF